MGRRWVLDYKVVLGSLIAPVSIPGDAEECSERLRETQPDVQQEASVSQGMAADSR